MKALVLLLFMLILLDFAFGQQHIIRFSNDSTCSNTRYDMQVKAGDTIIWVGDFSTCPLSNTAVPNGATAFRSGNDVVYMYVVKMGGEFKYEGPDVVSADTVGELYEDGTNSSSIVGNATPLYVVQEQGQNVLYSDLHADSSMNDYTLSIYDANGKMVLGTSIDLSTSRNVLPQLTTGIYLMRIARRDNVILSQQIWQP